MNINVALIIKFYNSQSIQKEIFLKFRNCFHFVDSPKCE